MNKLILAFAAVLLFSCKKETVETPINNSSELKHAPLAIGNYWVYNNYQIDTAQGTEVLMNNNDSIVIAKDTLINTIKYFVRMGKSITNGNTFKVIDCIRDSSGYLVNSSGLVLFAENNFTDTIYRWSIPGNNSNYINSYSLMEVLNKPVSTPAGTFYQGLNAKETISQSNIPVLIRQADHVYVENIGLVFEILYTSVWIDGWIEKRLVEYQIN